MVENPMVTRRWNQSEQKHFCFCAGCDEAIFIGEAIYSLPSGDVVHADNNCLKKYNDAVLRIAGED